MITISVEIGVQFLLMDWLGLRDMWPSAVDFIFERERERERELVILNTIKRERGSLVHTSAISFQVRRLMKSSLGAPDFSKA